MKRFAKTQPFTALLIACMISTTGMLSAPNTGDSIFLPFGGRVTTYFPGCLFPPGVALYTTGVVPKPLMYVPGTSFSYLNGPPTHPGQALLGMATVPVPCIIICYRRGTPFPCPYLPQPFSFLIWYHGSSL